MVRMFLVVTFIVVSLLYAEDIGVNRIIGEYHSTPEVVSLTQCHEEANDHFKNKNYPEALRNYEKIVSYLQRHELSDPAKLLNALCGSMFCYEELNESKFAKKTFDELVYEVALLREEVENVDWFRNSSVYSIYKQNTNRCYPKIYKTSLPDMNPEENCQLQCNGYAVAAAFACGRVPNIAIQALCYSCIFGLEQLCVRCCKGEGFWENCVKGLRRLFHDPEHPTNPDPHPYE